MLSCGFCQKLMEATKSFESFELLSMVLRGFQFASYNIIFQHNSHHPHHPHAIAYINNNCHETSMNMCALRSAQCGHSIVIPVAQWLIFHQQLPYSRTLLLYAWVTGWVMNICTAPSYSPWSSPLLHRLTTAQHSSVSLHLSAFVQDWQSVSTSEQVQKVLKLRKRKKLWSDTQQRCKNASVCLPFHFVSFFSAVLSSELQKLHPLSWARGDSDILRLTRSAKFLLLGTELKPQVIPCSGKWWLILSSTYSRTSWKVKSHTKMA